MTTAEEIKAWEGWQPLRRRTNRITDMQQQANLWIGVMLRRYAEKHPDGLAHYRTERAWGKLIEWQATSLDPDKPLYFDCKLSEFLHAGALRMGKFGYLEVGPNRLGSDNPWSILYRATQQKVDVVGRVRLKYYTEEYSINRMPTLDEDVASAWDKHYKRLGQEKSTRPQ